MGNIHTLKQQRQGRVDMKVFTSNQRRCFHDYVSGERVLIINKDIKGC